MNMKNISIISYALFFGFIGYALIMLITGDQRLVDGALNHEEMFLYEKFILALSLIGILITWIYAMYKALRRKHIKWLLLVYLIWPLAIVYIHKFDA